MSLDNSTIQNPLPGDLQARVENALNLITSLEAEDARLTKLISTKKLTINQLHEEEKETEKKIASLKAEIPALEKDVEVSKGILNELEARKTTANNELADTIQELRIADSSLLAKRDEVAKHNSDMDEAHNAIKTRQQTLAEKEAAHEAKVERIKRAIE